MRNNSAKRLFGVLAGSLMLSGALSAASISGQFNVTGNILVNTTEDVFGNMVIGDQTGLTQLQLTGSFSDLAPNQTATTLNLVGPANTPPGPVTPGTPFSLPNYIVLPDGINLDAMNIPVTNTTVCTSTYSGPCVAYSGSPIVLTYLPGVGTIAQFGISGQAHHASMTDYAPFQGLYTSQFVGDTPFQVVSMFFTNGFITNSYSGNFVVTPVVTPEPASMALLGAGLFGLGILGKRKFAK